MKSLRKEPTERLGVQLNYKRKQNPLKIQLYGLDGKGLIHRVFWNNKQQQTLAAKKGDEH